MLTRPLARVPDARLLAADVRETPVPEGHWGRATASAWVPPLLEALPVCVHPHDLRWTALAEPTGFGCCGYVPDGGPNLACRCGHGVGVFVDECSFGVEVRLAEVWGPAVVAQEEAGALGERLDRLAEIPPADVRAYVTTRWDPERAADERPKALGFAVRRSAEGLVADMIVDGEARPLVLAPLALARAIALRRLSIGEPRLVLAYERVGADNRVLATTFLVRRGDDVEIVEGQGAEVRGWRLWGEWVEEAWTAAVDGWMARG